ncbi:hypothetical protein [Desulfonatronovibrio magnus]|nr:hypothetical protein [Desulfonatronovibrio magnus]
MFWIGKILQLLSELILAGRSDYKIVLSALFILADSLASALRLIVMFMF